MRLFKNLNADSVIYGIKIFLGILAILCFIAAYQSMQIRHVEKYRNSTLLSQARAVPNSSSAFLLDEYKNGATSIEIKGSQGRFLGSDQARSIFAANITIIDGDSGQPRTKLKVFDARSHTPRHEANVSGCSNISKNNLLYCQNEHGTHVTGIHALTGKNMVSFPTPNPDAQLFLLGTRRHSDIIVARNTETGFSAINTLYSVSGNQMRWSKQLNGHETCNVINNNRTILCQKPIGGSPDATQVTALNAANGDEITTYTSTGKITPAADGWIEHPEKAGSEDFKIFTFHGHTHGSSKQSPDNAFFPLNADHQLGNAEALVYPGHSLTGLESTDSGIINVNGNLVYRTETEQDDNTRIIALDDPAQIVTLDHKKLITASRTGSLILLQSKAAEQDDNITYEVFDIDAQTPAFTLEQANNSAISVVDGLFAITENYADHTAEGRLQIFLPK